MLYYIDHKIRWNNKDKINETPNSGPDGILPIYGGGWNRVCGRKEFYCRTVEWY